MNKKWLFVCGALVLTTASLSLFFMQSSEKKAFHEKERLIPFQASMEKRDPHMVGKILNKKLRKDPKWQRYQALYEKHILNGKPQEEVRIPKIIHQIWLGGPLPEKYKTIQKSWKQHHPDWEYRLWTDEDAKTFKMQNRALFESAVNWGEKADIFRYEILYQIGGLYVDTDFECLRPMDLLHHLTDFYIGMDTVERKFQSPRLLNGLIASIPNHPILKECLSSMSGSGARDNFDLIQARTGPGLITRVFMNHAKDETHKNVALPSSYFYPLPACERCNSMGGPIKEEWAEEESYAIHYWDGSWIK